MVCVEQPQPRQTGQDVACLGIGNVSLTRNSISGYNISEQGLHSK